MAWRRYDRWSDVLHAAGRHEYLYYRAPLDYRPHAVRVVRVYKNRKIRLDPETADVDPFTVDRGHLDRFMWLE